MRVNSMFLAFVAVVVLLTFSTPFVPLAQQNTVYATAQDVKSIKFPAAWDASREVRLFWGRVDDDIVVLSSGCGIIIGACAGCIVGRIISTSDDRNEAILIGAIVGSIIGGTAFFAVVRNNQTGAPPPLPIRFMGKSPEYVQSYTDAYRETKTRSFWKK